MLREIVRELWTLKTSPSTLTQHRANLSVTTGMCSRRTPLALPQALCLALLPSNHILTIWATSQLSDLTAQASTAIYREMIWGSESSRSFLNLSSCGRPGEIFRALKMNRVHNPRGLTIIDTSERRQLPTTRFHWKRMCWP